MSEDGLRSSTNTVEEARETSGRVGQRAAEMRAYAERQLEQVAAAHRYALAGNLWSYDGDAVSTLARDVVALTESLSGSEARVGVLEQQLAEALADGAARSDLWRGRFHEVEGELALAREELRIERGEHKAIPSRNELAAQVGRLVAREASLRSALEAAERALADAERIILGRAVDWVGCLTLEGVRIALREGRWPDTQEMAEALADRRSAAQPARLATGQTLSEHLRGTPSDTVSAHRGSDASCVSPGSGT